MTLVHVSRSNQDTFRREKLSQTMKFIFAAAGANRAQTSAKAKISRGKFFTGKEA